MKLSRHIWQFDVLRAIAVLAVMLFHIGHNWRSGLLAPYMAWGWCGVDLFFVLSGFLITGILLETKSDRAYFRNFYARRALRIWPLYFGLLAAMMEVLPWFAPQLAAPSIATAYPRWAYLLFVQNFFRDHKVLGPLSATWSLAVEEQFYAVWPVAVRLLSAKWLKRVLLILLVTAPIGSLLVAYSGIHFDAEAIRMDGLAIGALLALAVRKFDAAVIRKTGLLLLGPSTVAAVIAFRLDCMWLLISLLPVAFASLLCLSLTTGLIPKSRVLCYTGKLSYGLYLLHLPVFDVVRSDRVRALLPQEALANDLCYTALAFAATYAVASASWYCMEKPFLSLKRYFDRPPDTGPLAAGTLGNSTRSSAAAGLEAAA